MREPFFNHCPICESRATTPVIEFPELVYVRCAGCGLIYKSEQVRKLGVGYEEEYFRFNRAKYMERWDHRVRKCRRQILACLEYAPNAKTLLDIGCSAGYVLEAARREGVEATGLDLSEFAVNLCRERGFQVETGSMSRMPFPDGSFDIVTLKHTLEHVDDPMPSLCEIRRVLRPGGIAFVIVPDAAYWKLSLIPRHGRPFRPDRRGWQHHVYYYSSNLADACARAGLVSAKAGKAIFRRRLAKGPGTIIEALRWSWLMVWTGVSALIHFRREIQLIARRPVEAAVVLPAA